MESNRGTRIRELYESGKLTALDASSLLLECNPDDASETFHALSPDLKRILAQTIAEHPTDEEGWAKFRIIEIDSQFTAQQVGERKQWLSEQQLKRYRVIIAFRRALAED